jgi:indole-3-glycerol phosphate synthase
MSDILNKILAVKAQEVAAAETAAQLASLRAEVSNSELRAGLRGLKLPCVAKSPPASPP